ncbi:MAG: hypothetical protein EOO89_33450 [Pedobacter sp.]|nr:MAG: hypothetical protein EOO89_33450 [Pedobacter sp.]
MIALEFKELVEVSTPKGDGLIWYMMDYGPHSDTLYTIIIKDTGECWQMCHKDFRIKTNVTMGIGGSYGKTTPFQEKGNNNDLLKKASGGS